MDDLDSDLQSASDSLARLVEGLVALKRSGKDVVLVSSGAIAAGVESLKLESRPTTLPELQMAAAIGQTRNMRNHPSQCRVHCAR